ncbi:FAS1 domain-containing protein [Ilyonectria robusta]|uniref:FAS1 domain-containing protein n=1 Tax=Ilyonectria robusta TaxID=1079257 RepID=UPI001E8DEF44|nr:FAS1 domain-containing protein [Ilyonectria robusta]KAH8670636.1 FAS1 domain-containing protein [Ilyonectria robusta]
MRLTVSLASVAAVSALAVLKDGPDFFKDQIHHAESLLGDTRSKLTSSFDEAVDFLSSGIANAIHNAEEKVRNEVGAIFAQESGHGNRGSAAGYDVDLVEHDQSNYTIYELISKSNHTTEFYKLVKDHSKVVKLLNDSDASYTLFVPIDKAFEDIPKHKKPSDEFVEDLLDYHVGVGSYPAVRILTTHTLPTALEEKFLGGKPQRLRTSVGISGVRVNVYSKVVAVNIKAKNGYIHAVNKILIPPTMIGREISFFPAQFSTLLLAYDKTDFVKYIHAVKMIGSTVFAPSNSAWERLGPRANAFLFNTEKGKKYLTALLKYQIVPNITLYSDEIYYGDDKTTKPEVVMDGVDHFHLELHPLLEKSSLGVDVYNWKGWTSIVVNGAVKVGFQDGIGKNGVIHVVEDIPLPPCKRGGKESDAWTGEIEVEDLMERLSEFVDEDDEQDWITGDL